MRWARSVAILVFASLLSLPLGGQHPATGGNGPRPQVKSSIPNGPPKLGAWLRTHKDLPLDQQEKALQSDPDFKRRSPQVQAHLMERLHKFNSLPANEKKRALINMEYWEKLTQAQKEQIKQAHAHMLTLPTERKVMVRKELHTLRQLPRDKREQRLQSDEFKSTFSDQEQAILRNLAEINPPATPNENATPR